jgi:C4-dicarboxylate-specific signal transduction histidine kinase
VPGALGQHGLPVVQGEHHGLLQALLNLSQNSGRALDGVAGKDFSVSAEVADGRVVVRVRDSGPGVENPDRLFQPFQPSADGTGIGLYVSRAIVRSFDGNLCYEPQGHGSCFAMELLAAEE